MVPNISGKTDPFPTDYMSIASRELLTQGEAGASISTPRVTEPWSITEPMVWYVCVKHANREETVALLRGGRVIGTITGAAATYCRGSEYQAIEPSL
jgi:3-dehydroquinate synthetase